MVGGLGNQLFQTAAILKYRLAKEKVIISFLGEIHIPKRVNCLSSIFEIPDWLYFDNSNKINLLTKSLARGSAGLRFGSFFPLLGVNDRNFIYNKSYFKNRKLLLIQQLKELESQISGLISKKIAANVNLEYQSIKSPVKGIVFDLKPTNVGFVAQTSQPIMKIVPIENLEANILVPTDKIGFVREGMDVDISIDSFPASDFGVLEGVVAFIGSDALPPDSSSSIRTFSFPVTIDLSDQFLNLKDGNSLPLQTGMSLTANIKLRKVSYLRLLLSNFKSKTDSLKEI